MPYFSFEQLTDVSHRPKQLHRPVRKREKAFLLIEATGLLVLRIDDDRERGDLAPNGAVKGVGEEKPAVTPSLLPSIHRETAQARRRRQWISRQLPHRLL